MKSLKLSFTTFLKICASTPRGKISQIKKFTGKGGYDFYKVLKRLVGELGSGKIDLPQALLQVDAITRQSEREHTRAALLKFNSWLVAENVIWQTPPKSMFQSETGLLSVKLEPEIAFTRPDDQQKHVWYLWNLAKPELKDELAGQGMSFLVRDLKKTIAPDSLFGIFDLREEKTLGEDKIRANSDVQLRYNLLMIELIWLDIHNPSLTVEDTLSHMSALKLPPPTPRL